MSKGSKPQSNSHVLDHYGKAVCAAVLMAVRITIDEAKTLRWRVDWSTAYKPQAIVKTPSTSLYIFAYGSLIWRPDFAHTEVHRARVPGYARRFWQASHDHRGTPSSPGRVLTLVPVANAMCEGLVYRVPDDVRDEVLDILDKREQDGYERVWVRTLLDGHDIETVSALTWIASEANPSWVGEESLPQVATLIATRRGPSGSNREYLFRLHEAFEHMGIHDAHIAELVNQVSALPGDEADGATELPTQ